MDDLSDIDRDALERALAKMLDDPQERAYFEERLKSDDRAEVCRTAAYRCQIRDLNLRPWESPPCFGNIAPRNEHKQRASMLLQRLLDAGASQWEPEPLVVLYKVKEKKT